MKKLNLIFILLALLALSSGCKKDKDENENLPASFSAKVEGVFWTGTKIVAVHASGSDLIQITASGASQTEQIVLAFTGSGPGTYEMGDDNLGSCSIGGNVFTTIFDNTPTGSIVITKYDATNGIISGTFSFVGEDINGNDFAVTEGKFENLVLKIM